MSMKTMEIKNKSAKLVIIGIDSATFDVIDPMIKSGKLPNLSNLIKGGTSGSLQSTIPPVTPPAWVSFMTGKNPGKHGVFDFFVSPSYGYVRPVWNSKYIKSKTIWKILSEQGQRLGLINMPMTHPPEKINGFIIPGVQYSFDGDADFSHPPELMKELNAVTGEYKVICGDLESLYTNNLDNFLKEWREIFEMRRKAILYLLEHKEWDIFTAVFYSVDVVQHHFWKFFDRSHPQYNSELSAKYGNVIYEFYELIDSAIGDILQRIGDKTGVVVVSDHGAGPEEEGFSINNWLDQEGFLNFKPLLSPLWKFRFPHIFYKILKRLKFQGIGWTVPLDQLNRLGRTIDPREGLNVPVFIDWRKTQAYAGNHTEQGIYINLKGREPMGMVGKGKEYDELRESIINKLKSIRDSKTGELLAIEIYKKEEIYSGPFIDEAPDIFVVMKGGKCLMQKEIYHKTLFYNANKSSGTHRMNGIFIIKGNGIKAGHIVKDVNIIDMAPTILYALSFAVPEDMDGKVVIDAFDPEHIRSNPVVKGISSDFEVLKGEGVLDSEESEKVKQSLRDLGYFG